MTPSLADAYRQHVESVQRSVTDALEQSARAGSPFEGLILHAGAPRLHHADDQELPFRPVAHFARMAPMRGPHHLLLLPADGPSRLVRVVPRSYWVESPDDPPALVSGAWEILEVDSPAAAQQLVRSLIDPSDWAYVGNDPSTAGQLGLDGEAVEPATLVASLDWDRAFKTPFEIHCIGEAAARAATGHAAVRRGFAERQSERSLHFRYLEASAQLDEDCPYPNIIAWDDASAILHATRRRLDPPDPGSTLLIDAGATCLGYACDITRTYAGESASPEFCALLDGMDSLQRELVARVRPGVDFVDLHRAAVQGVALLLEEVGIVRVDAAEACERQLPNAFFPHGLGHHLGLQVHDVGGRQADRTGRLADPSPEFPNLRTARRLEEGHVITIEPGLYFIPQLLEPLRAGPNADAVHWPLVESLLSHGGIRIEDDICVTADGGRDLSREWVPGHRSGEARAS